MGNGRRARSGFVSYRSPVRLSRSTSALLAAALAVLLGLPLALLAAAPAGAATTAGWAAWDPLTGSGGSFTSTMRLPAGGFPAAAVTSDSRAGQVGVQSGASSWLSATTPVGAKYGSSQGQPYLNLRPRADSPTAPSTTTYTFERPTPASGWTFVLGDIDADQVTITARGTGGRLLTGAELGFRSSFNYCAVTPSPSCTGTDVPTWDPATGVLVGNATASDTSGASAWFEPTVPVTSLTFEFLRRSGFPVYQTWFASLARDVSGTVTLEGVGPLTGATLTLLSPDGARLATTTSGDDGTYSFLGFTAADGYTVEATPPPDPDGPGLIVEGPFRLPADLADTDATGVDFLVREIVPVPVSGTVRTEEGIPVPGATVTIDVPGGSPLTTTTDSQGAYLIDDVPAGPHTITLALPEGFPVTPPPLTIDVPPGSEVPITDQDFVVPTFPSLTGTVTAGGTGVPGAVVTFTGPGGATGSAVTGADGTYRFDQLPTGPYTVSVAPPAGFTVDGTGARAVTVGSDDVTGVDFALARPGAIGGTVTDDQGAPVPGAEVLVSGPDGDVPLTTDDAGTYFVDGLPPGDYTIALTVPEGYTAGGPVESAVTLTSAGESRLDQDFAVTPVDAPVDPPVTPPVDPGGPPGGGTVPDDGPSTPRPAPAHLAATGLDVGALLAVGLALTATGVLVAAGGRTLRRRA
ncbi:hypothetical protein ASE15_19280 [Oerskovia sp. Root22]|nr:hypothetical protein ASE15_19280 [Oerskovia sp. Root22]